MSFSLPRNTDGDVSPWCYVAEHEDGVYWKYCEIPTCQSKAVTPAGPRALSFRSGGQCPGRGGGQCRRWEEKPPGLKMFASLVEAFWEGDPQVLSGPPSLHG